MGQPNELIIENHFDYGVIKIKFLRRIKRYISRNKKSVILFSALLLFPALIILIYAIPWFQTTTVKAGDLLAYYGAVFGIVASFLLYRDEISKKRLERQRELKPEFSVHIRKASSARDIFELTISKNSSGVLSFLYLYDEFVSETVKKEISLRVSYNLSVEESSSENIDHNITVESDIIDGDGYPKYVQLICSDIDGNYWNCCFRKVNDCGNYYYCPDAFEIV